MSTTGVQPDKKDNKSMEKEAFEQVPTTRAGDKVLRRRRKSQSFFPLLFRNIRRLVKGTGGG